MDWELDPAMHSKKEMIGAERIQSDQLSNVCFLSFYKLKRLAWCVHVHKLCVGVFVNQKDAFCLCSCALVGRHSSIMYACM